MPFVAVNEIDVYFELHGTGAPLFAMRCRLTDRRFDPDAGVPNVTLAVFDGGHTFMIQDRSAFPTIIEFLESAGGAS